MKKLRVSVSLFPWLIYIIVFIRSLYEYKVVNKEFYNSDELLLYGTALVIFWVEREGIIKSIKNNALGHPMYGMLALCLGLIVYTAGQLYPIIYLEIWGLFIIAGAIVMAFASKEYFKSALFIIIAGTVFVIMGRVAPELLSSELATGLATVTAKILTATMFPVTANGVTLFFGPYSAEVSHACSGMNSIFSLLALSVLYLREGIHRKYWHIGILIIFVIPVAIMTNLIRVNILVLITWYFGTRYAQGIYHDLTGIIVFVVALLLLAVLDQILLSVDDKKGKKNEK